MHLRMPPLQVLIKLYFLSVGEDLADVLIGPVTVRSHLGQAFFARKALVLHEGLLSVTQPLKDWCDSRLLLRGEIQFLGQYLQHLCNQRHVVLCGALALDISLRSSRSGDSSMRRYSQCDEEGRADCNQAIHRTP